MRRSVRAVLAALVILVHPLGAQAPQPQGHLLIIGGNGMTGDIEKRAVEVAGGSKGLVAVLPQASELAETGDNNAAMWTKAGVGRAIVVDTKEPAKALETIKAATFIWFPGGDQVKLMKAFAGTGIAEAIQARYRDGALVGGTSAGAAVMSKLMITGDGFDLQAITAGKTDIAEGLGLWPDVIVDQHFLKRQRDNRLISAVLDHPQVVGIGIDETTAIFVTGRSFEVLGKSSVVVFDARKATVDKVAPGELATGRNLRLSVLKAGMRWDWDQ